MDFSLGLVIGVIVGGIGLYLFFRNSGQVVIARAKMEADGLKRQALLEAESRAKEIELAAQKQRLASQENFEQEQSQQRRKFDEKEAGIEKRQIVLDRKSDILSVKERTLDEQAAQVGRQQKDIAARDSELAALLKQERERLLDLSSFTPQQAKELLFKRLEEELSTECGQLIQKSVSKAEDEAKEKARSIILQAIERCASVHTSEHTVSQVPLPDDTMKGRVIGKEGRNIKAFEKTAGVDLIVDETPGIIIVSCFDPLRREVARQTLERLIADGRIHPARIEEIYATVVQEMEEELLRLGKLGADDANVPIMHKSMLPTLGRLAYRTSYGQNVLRHSVEVAYLSQMIAAELGLDGQIARRAGLLHDIGKAMDHEQEGGHPAIGMEFLRKFGESEAVLNAAGGHHGDIPATTPYTVIVMTADAISASRPGARRESVEKYVRRLRDLEEICINFTGVQQAYAIQAGREVRVIADARMLDDSKSAKLARDIAGKIQQELRYPGEVKVTVLREVRSVAVAR